MQLPPTLIVFSGLPGIGKTTTARALATRLGVPFLRIDVIEQAIRNAGIPLVGTAGYGVANALAACNLLLGQSVIADCVNPVRESRLGWQAVATRASVRLVNLHLVCTDPAEHRRRVESRAPDIDGHVLPSWEQVTRHDFESWDGDDAPIDTAALTPPELVELCVGRILGGQATL